MIVIYIIFLLILIAMPCSLYFEKLGDFFSEIEKLFIKIKNNIKEKTKGDDKVQEYTTEIKKLNSQIEKEKHSFQEETNKLIQELKEVKDSDNNTILSKNSEIKNLKAEVEKLKRENEKTINNIVNSKNKIIEEIKRNITKENKEKDEIIQKLTQEQQNEEKKKNTEINDLKNQLEETTKLLLEFQNKEEEHKKRCGNDYRLIYPKYLRCKDGDYVKSKAEREIDNFFYENRIWHIYEHDYKYNNKKRPLYPDFYLPDYNLIIEYFGLTNQKYEEKKEWKIDVYKKDKDINFEYLTYEDDGNMYAKLREICIKYSIPMKK